MSTAENVDRGDNHIPSAPETERTEEGAAAAAAAVAAAEAAAMGEKTAEAKAEEGGDKAEAAEPPRNNKGQFIPKERFNEAVGKERAKVEAANRQVAELQERLKQFDRGQDVAKLEEEIAALEKSHAQHLLDGNADKAAEAMRQIRHKERTIALSTSETMSAEARRAAAEEVRMDMAIAKLEETYPMLSAESDDYDQDVTDMVLATQRSLIENERMSPSQALVAAAQKVMSKIMPSAKEEPAADKKGLAAAAGATERERESVTRNIDAARRQPPSAKEVGLDSDKAGIQGKVDVSKLSYEEFTALPEATKARLRGDML